jgi:hypothetical protein
MSLILTEYTYSLISTAVVCALKMLKSVSFCCYGQCPVLLWQVFCAVMFSILCCYTQCPVLLWSVSWVIWSVSFYCYVPCPFANMFSVLLLLCSVSCAVMVSALCCNAQCQCMVSVLLLLCSVSFC